MSQAHDDAALIRDLQTQVEQLRLMSDNVPVGMAYYDLAGFSCRYANAVYCRMFGLTPESIVGRSFAEIIGADTARLIQPQVDAMLRDKRASSYERQMQVAADDLRWIDVHLLPHLSDTGVLQGAFVLITDITRHRQAELALRQSEERLAKFMHASAEGIVFHRLGLITDVNPPLLQLLDLTLEEMMGRPTLDFVAPSERARVASVIASGAEITYQSLAVHRDGSHIPVEFIVRTMQHQDEKLRMTIVRDMRDRLAAQERIHFLAHHDPLTGLPNRNSFIDRIEHLIQRAESAGDVQDFGLLFIDLDHFKRVNDSLGHLVGDQLLKTVAERITLALRSSDLVARFGGDEFIVLVSDSPSLDAVREVAHKLLQVIATSLVLADTSISVTPSIGVALYLRDGRTPDELIKHADTAMYDAKTRGRAGFRFFVPAMAEAAREALALEGRLAQAVRDQEFVLFFQPQRSLQDGRLVGAEALVRWQHPERGLVGPDQFIRLAESRRLMLPIGRWVMREALRHATRWQAAGWLPGPVSVNLSSSQFEAPDFVDGVIAVLAEAGAQGTQLELELTEHMLASDLWNVQLMLGSLKSHGVRIAIDDFGTGYTSLAHLKDLPIDRLKIDRSFVKDLPDDTRSGAIAQAIVQVARSLGLDVVAEGVETVAQRDWLRAQGCSAMQGFLDARPMPAEDFERWLKQARPVG